MNIAYDQSWYALYVRFQSEYRIASNLRENLGIEALVPSRKLWRKRGGKMEVFTRPLIETYVFIRAGLDSYDFRKLYNVNGVIGIVKEAGKPVRAPSEQIISLEKLGASDSPVHEIEYKKFKPNDMVEVIDGPMRGAIGNFIKTDFRTGHFIVSLDLFNRVLVTDIEACNVRPY